MGYVQVGVVISWSGFTGRERHAISVESDGASRTLFDQRRELRFAIVATIHEWVVLCRIIGEPIIA